MSALPQLKKRMRTKPSKKMGMKEVSTPLAAISTENSMMDFFLPKMSEMIPAENVPTANPRKKKED